MHQLEQLKTAVEALSKNDFDEFKLWLMEYVEQRWDAQIERDSKDKNSPLARLTAKAAADHKSRKPGTLRGTVVYMSPDFDTPLDEFKEYME